MKVKVAEFGGEYPIGIKLILDNPLIEQVLHFNYLEFDI